MIKSVYTYEEAGEVLRNVEVQLRAQREGEMMALEYILVVALESGSNDPMAVFLTLGLIHLVM